MTIEVVVQELSLDVIAGGPPGPQGPEGPQGPPGGTDPDALLRTLADAKGDLLIASAADTIVRFGVGTPGQALIADPSTATGFKWVDLLEEIVSYEEANPLATFVGHMRYRLNVNGTFVEYRITTKDDSPPAGQAIIADLNLNGTTVFTTQANRPQIATGQITGSTTTFDVADFSAGDYVTFDCDQVGSGGGEGVNLLMQVAWRRR